MKDDFLHSPLDISSVDELLANHAKKFNNKAAIIAVDPDTNEIQEISYQKLGELVGRVGAFLTSLGIGKHDRFAILMHNGPEVLLFELAGALIGATTVPLDFKRDTIDRKIFKISDTNARALFVKYEGSLQDAKLADLKKLKPDLIIRCWATFDEFLSLLPRLQIAPAYQGTLDDHYLVLYTSGTTALPKGVLLSTRACLLNAMGIIDWQKFTNEDRFTIILPLHHINSTEFCLSMLLVGGTIILNSRYSASKFWHIVSKYKATNTSIVPTILHDLLVRHDEFVGLNLDISSLKRICIGSAPVLPEETLRFYETFTIRVVQGYGQTETALRVAGVPIDVDDTTYRKLVKSNTIGTELLNNHLGILDENNNEKKEGEHGEICISGPILADGYLHNPDETRKSFVNGWFHSGDLGYWKLIDGKKYYFIIGRIKEIIIKGGVNISPSSIEDALLKEFPQIDEVSVVGYPDERMGEEIAAVIVPKTSLIPIEGSTLMQSIREASQTGSIPSLSTFEAPKKVFIIDSLPKTSTGKIQRVEVKIIVADLIKKETQNHYYVRQINPSEKDTLNKAVEINNKRWLGLPATLREFIARATNGLIFGVFEEKEGLVGSLSCVRLRHQIVNKLTTWNEATANGTLANNDPNGDTILCVAISVKPYSSSDESSRSREVSSTSSRLGDAPSGASLRSNSIEERNLKRLAKQHIEVYVISGNDHVLEFHRKPKGGLPGATVWKILENGRPDDKESMGYNVLMKYPPISSSTKIVRSSASSPSILLIEHTLLYAKEHGIKKVIAFSRPAGFRKYLYQFLIS